MHSKLFAPLPNYRSETHQRGGTDTGQISRPFSPEVQLNRRWGRRITSVFTSISNPVGSDNAVQA